MFLKDAVPDEGRALAQYRAWLSPALDGASLGRLYADLFGRPLPHDVDGAGSFQDVLHRTLTSCAQRGRPLVQLLARAVRTRADRTEIVEQLAVVLGLAPVIEIAGFLARHGCPETLCGEMAQAIAIDRDTSYLGHGHTGRAAWIDALVWLEELPAAARPLPLLDYLERLMTAWSASHDGIPAEITRWLDDHRESPERKRGDAPPAGAPGTRAPGQPIGPASVPSSARHDLFLAHSPGGKPSAHALYSLLQGQIRVFLAERSIPPGDRWDHAIAAAQRASRATVILIAQDAEDSWYLGDEIVTAIALHRAAPDTHRIIPVLLAQGISVPYGLSHVQVLDASGDTLPSVAQRLRAIVASPISASSTRQPTSELPSVAPMPAAGGDCDHRRLHARLMQLTDTLFEEILFLAPVPRAHIAPTTAPLATRILHVAQLAAVNPALGRSLAALLDERAPWTRGGTT